MRGRGAVPEGAATENHPRHALRLRGQHQVGWEKFLFKFSVVNPDPVVSGTFSWSGYGNLKKSLSLARFGIDHSGFTILVKLLKILNSSRLVDDDTKALVLDQTIEKVRNTYGICLLKNTFFLISQINNLLFLLQVSFCAPDRNFERGFSYICRDGTTRNSCWPCLIISVHLLTSFSFSCSCFLVILYHLLAF